MATETGKTATRKPAENSEAEQRSPQEIQAEIEASRVELGDTVAELAEKADVKKQAKRKIDETKANVATKRDEIAQKAGQTAQQVASQATQAARENPVRAAAGAFVGGLVIGWMLWRR
jgi:ElaB/YqjD/DUF883 family membrane-anchored ribosome-binding protein